MTLISPVNRAFNFAKADTVAVARAPASHDKRVAGLEKHPDMPLPLTGAFPFPLISEGCPLMLCPAR